MAKYVIRAAEGELYWSGATWLESEEKAKVFEDISVVREQYNPIGPTETGFVILEVLEAGKRTIEFQPGYLNKEMRIKFGKAKEKN